MEKMNKINEKVMRTINILDYYLWKYNIHEARQRVHRDAFKILASIKTELKELEQLIEN